MPGAYKANVLPVVKTAKQCGIKKKSFSNQLKGCVKKKSLAKCAKCLKNEQCGMLGGKPMYCCPYMKRCVGRGTRCQWPVAQCQPMCYDFKSNAECKCKSKDFPAKWQKNTCKDTKKDLPLQIELGASLKVKPPTTRKTKTVAGTRKVKPPTTHKTKTVAATTKAAPVTTSDVTHAEETATDESAE